MDTVNLSIRRRFLGRENQHWAEMLLLMYLRWAERNGFTASILHREEPDDWVGIVRATFEVRGENAYGLLSSEVGIHRLIRTSPYDPQHRRYTSHAEVFMVEPPLLRLDTVRSYILDPYKLVKDHRSGRVSDNPEGVLDGDLGDFLNNAADIT